MEPSQDCGPLPPRRGRREQGTREGMSYRVPLGAWHYLFKTPDLAYGHQAPQPLWRTVSHPDGLRLYAVGTLLPVRLAGVVAHHQSKSCSGLLL